MIKLLDRPLKTLTIYALIVLLCSIPVYFFVIDLIWVHEVSEHNQIVADATKKNLAALHLDDSRMKSAVRLWNSLQPETRIVQANKLKKDSTYNRYRKHKYTQGAGYDRFEGLVTYFRMNDKIYSLTVEAKVEESYETIAAITSVTLLFFVILLIGFLKLNKRLSKKLWKPFYGTLEKIRAFDLISHKAIGFEKSQIKEFEALNSEINRLIDNNVAIFRQQKEFTENASHELQTPLAIVQSKLDLLLQDASIRSEQAHIIEEANHALARISRINKNLLLLAKIDNQQFSEMESILVSRPLEEILDVLSDLFGEKVIEFEVVSECTVNGNAILVEIMLTNLLMNALRHTDPGAKITVSLSACELSVANTGNSVLDAEKLFKRFSAASVHTPGSGLGLAIVKEICNRYGWTVDYRYIGFMHIFTVGFKPPYSG